MNQSNLKKALSYIQETNLNDLSFDFAVVSGSGLAQCIVDYGEIIDRYNYREIPEAPITSVKGHRGELIAIKFNKSNKIALVFSGRVHLYEGFSLDELLFQVRIAKLLGIKEIIISCAVGSLNSKSQLGELGLITDHIDFSNASIFNIGEPISIYDNVLSNKLFETALRCQIPISRGTLCSILGPSYETPAEARIAKSIGADWMSMSTVKETTEASRLGIAVAGIAGITNAVNETGLGHDDVVKSARKCSIRFWRLLNELD